jgi:chitosanase
MYRISWLSGVSVRNVSKWTTPTVGIFASALVVATGAGMLAPARGVVAADTPMIVTGGGYTAVQGLQNPAAKHRAEQIISSFENSTTVIQYGYAENLHDGRGITAGRAGFTSGTDDLLAVVQLYLKNHH